MKGGRLGVSSAFYELLCGRIRLFSVKMRKHTFTVVGHVVVVGNVACVDVDFCLSALESGHELLAKLRARLCAVCEQIGGEIAVLVRDGWVCACLQQLVNCTPRTVVSSVSLCAFVSLAQIEAGGLTNPVSDLFDFGAGIAVGDVDINRGMQRRVGVGAVLVVDVDLEVENLGQDLSRL